MSAVKHYFNDFVNESCDLIDAHSWVTSDESLSLFVKLYPKMQFCAQLMIPVLEHQVGRGKMLQIFRSYAVISKWH